MRSSRIMKFAVAHSERHHPWAYSNRSPADVSSSKSSGSAPPSIASITLAACDVLPDAHCVDNEVVGLVKGKLLIKGEMSTPVTARPSSALILSAVDNEQ